MDLPTHGPLSCAECFADCHVPERANGWQLINDPGYWGATDPVILVLGQSKGNRQRKVYARGETAFDSVAFADVRDRVAEILGKIGVHLDKNDVDKHFSATEETIAFASLLRCSLSDPEGKTSGNPVTRAMGDPRADQWIVNCMKKWLSRPSPRLRLVILFGLTEGYVLGVKARLRDLHGLTFENIDKVAAKAAGVTWVFAQHPSKISENHYRSWISSLPHKKRDNVRPHVQRALNGWR